MRLFCLEDHTEETVIDYDRELLEARAYLARVKLLPDSVFAHNGRPSTVYTTFGPITYAIDNKSDSIAKAEAKVAYLEVLTGQEQGDA